MEKNTKILLGIGAVIAAYLILKPKKVDTPKVINTTDIYICPEGYSETKIIDSNAISENGSETWHRGCKDLKGNIASWTINPNYVGNYSVEENEALRKLMKDINRDDIKRIQIQ
jgi:hypothetical protein